MPTPQEFAAIQFDMILTAAVRIECMAGPEALARLRQLCAESLEGDPGPIARQLLAIVHGWCETGLPAPVEGMVMLSGKDALEIFAASVFDVMQDISLAFEEKAEDSMAGERVALLYAADKVQRHRDRLIETYERLKDRLIR